MSFLSNNFRPIVLFLVSCVASTAAAQSDSTANEAHLHFERGVELYQEGSMDAALAEFERSNQLAPTYKLLYNMAQVQAERHEYVAAIKLMNDYLQAGGDEISVERTRAVSDDIDKLRQRVAELSINVSVEGADVFVNDVAVGKSPLSAPVLVNVGTCRVRAEKPGFTPKLQTITVAGADQPRVSLELTRAPVLAQRGARTTTLRTDDMTPFWISMGAAVVLGGTTAVVGALALGANHDLDQSLDQIPVSSDKVSSERHKLRTMAALTDGFGAATAVAAGSALYFLIFPPEHTEVVPVTGVHARLNALPNGISVSGVF